jgi:CRISPR-associated protein Cas5 subtype I-B
MSITISVYTPYLGISGLIANFCFIGEFDARVQKFKGNKYINTIVRKDRSKLTPEKDKRYVMERIPVFMDNNRVVKEYADVFFEANAEPLKVRNTAFYKIGEDNVVFL